MNKWTITHIHSTLVFYVETHSGRKPHNVFSYMSWRITFIGSTNFLCFPAATGRRLWHPIFRLQPEGISNSPILLLQPEGGYNPLCSSDTNRRWLQWCISSSGRFNAQHYEDNSLLNDVLFLKCTMYFYWAFSYLRCIIHFYLAFCENGLKFN